MDVVAVSPHLSIAEWHNKNADDALYNGIKTYCELPVDLLLIEGFKQADFPKIELHRKSLNKPMLFHDDQHIIVLATDDINSMSEKSSIPMLDLNNIDEIADWVVNYANKIR